MNIAVAQGGGVDLIGDVHGCASLLERLLERLDYHRGRDGVWRHAHRRALFLGDLIDRGPEIRETVELVREMVAAGSAEALLGNHEISALRAFLHPGGARVPRVHKATLEQYSGHEAQWRDTLGWMLERPLCVEGERFRAVHACWDPSLVQPFLASHPDGRIDHMMLERASDPQSFFHQLFDRLTRGPQLRLPGARTITSHDGIERHSFRTSFWIPGPERYGDVVFQPDPLPDDLERRPLDESAKRRLVSYGDDQPPLFVGHYWCRGVPALIAANLACLDYSAVNGGALVAYRFDGERRLDADRLVWIDAARG
ncbi:metallophosphoesterase [Halotalea alkalilenta]|uniref:metallophosphoesterase n=1 Tax=Halotalea alkalilenta TaxID=376489 RepID=UPI000AA30E29|nr:metallophosphoesterase [Halotalea alkalilenta]